MDRDRQGRRRTADQNRGLRPLHPHLPDEWVSKSVRIAMPESDWGRLEALVREVGDGAATQARAYGLAMSHLIRKDPGVTPPEEMDWMDWERRKTLRLLFPGS